MKLQTYTIMSDYDGNDSFEVEASSVENAAFAALGVLGWNVVAPEEE